VYIFLYVFCIGICRAKLPLYCNVEVHSSLRGLPNFLFAFCFASCGAVPFGSCAFVFVFADSVIA